MTKIKYTQEQLNEAIRLHVRWLNGYPDGIRADFRNKDLSGLKFTDAILNKANFIRSDLTNCDFEESQLTHCKFQGANMKDSNFRYANFEFSNLDRASLISSDC